MQHPCRRVSANSSVAPQSCRSGRAPNPHRRPRRRAATGRFRSTSAMPPCIAGARRAGVRWRSPTPTRCRPVPYGARSYRQHLDLADQWVGSWFHHSPSRRPRCIAMFRIARDEAAEVFSLLRALPTISFASRSACSPFVTSCSSARRPRATTFPGIRWRSAGPPPAARARSRGRYESRIRSRRRRHLACSQRRQRPAHGPR